MSAVKAALVPLSLSSRRAQTLPFGTRARVALAQGDVEGGLALTGVDRRAGTAIYALRIANQSASPLRAHMTCTRSRGLPVTAYPLDVQVAPFSIAETLLPVRLAEVGPYDRALVKVSGSDIAFTLEAPAPPRASARKRWLKIAAASVVAILGAAFGAAVATPRIDLLAAPARAFAGSPLDIPYAFAGLGSMQYTLQTKDGRQLAAGLLTDRQGTLRFILPRNSGSQLVLVATLASPIGTAQASRRVVISQAPPAAVRKRAAIMPRIESFTIASPTVVAGAPLVVHYTTNAKSGQVWLIDETGRLWTSAPIFADGTTTLKVPQGAAGQKMRVVLHARNGTADAVSSLGITVQPGAVVAANVAATSPNAPLTLVLSAGRVAPGDDVTVTLKGNHGDSRISLTDAAGNTVEQGDVSAGQDAVTLSAPSVKTATTFYVVASISSGVSEQSLVQKLIVTPR